MNYVEALKKEIYSVLTENGDKAFLSSGSYCLDFFYLIGGLRGNYKDAIIAFTKAYYENKVLAIKILFYARDIRSGLGERVTFRMIMNYLCNFYPDCALKVLDYIPMYGRYDDLFSALYTPCEGKVIEIIKKQIEIDINNNEKGEVVSLLAKWMPSVNSSSEETTKMALRLCKLLNMNCAEYRKMLTSLRSGHIIENHLRVKDYSFDYDKIPSQAMFKYQNAFITNDTYRYKKYMLDVMSGKKVASTDTLYPYQIVREIINNYSLSEDKKQSLDILWKSIKRSEVQENTIIVRDGSGSMYSWGNPTPNDVATSLAILFSEQLTGPFKNTFITFSRNPYLVTIPEGSIWDKVQYVRSFSECENTNIEKVYNLLINTIKNNHIKKEDMIKRIVIISDMEFDSAINDKGTYMNFRKQYEELGYDFPELVFWNVNNRNLTFPVRMNEKNVKLISGSSKNVIDMITKGTCDNSYNLMLEVLERYNVFDSLNI